MVCLWSFAVTMMSASALVVPGRGPSAPRAAPRTVAHMLPPPGGPMNQEQMKAAADAMKNLTPEQIETMLGEVENMGPAERVRRPASRRRGDRYRARARRRSFGDDED